MWVKLKAMCTCNVLNLNKNVKRPTNFDLHVIVKEQVSQFKITVDNSVVMEVMDTLNSLTHEVSRLRLRYSFPTFVKL